jgi:5-methylcytosine-specific restriction endonuclease McrA
MITPENKYCPACKQVLPASSFKRNASKPGGLQCYCAPCTSIKSRERYERTAPNGIMPKKKGDYKQLRDRGLKPCSTCKKELPLDNFGKWPSRYDGLAHRCKECDRAHRINEAGRLSLKRWREENIDRLKESRRRWSNENRARVRFNTNRRHARKSGNGGSHTFEEWEYIKQLHDYRCLRCGKREPEIKLTKDHIMPLALGGHDGVSNLQPLCATCNSAKHTKHIDYRLTKIPTKKKHA